MKDWYSAFLSYKQINQRLEGFYVHAYLNIYSYCICNSINLLVSWFTLLSVKSFCSGPKPDLHWLFIQSLSIWLDHSVKIIGAVLSHLHMPCLIRIIFLLIRHLMLHVNSFTNHKVMQSGDFLPLKEQGYYLWHFCLYFVVINVSCNFTCI